MTSFQEGNTVISVHSSSLVITTVIIIYKCCMSHGKGNMKCEWVKWDHINMRSSKKQFLLIPKSILKHETSMS